MTTLRREANAFRAAANKLRREAADAPKKLHQAAVFDRLATELEDYLANGDDLDDVTFVNPPDAAGLFEEEGT
jgi:hypothetical protein